MKEKQYPAIASKVESYCAQEPHPHYLHESTIELVKELLRASFDEQDHREEYLSLICKLQTSCEWSPENLGMVLGNSSFELYDKNAPALARWGYQISMDLAPFDTNRNNLGYILRHHYSELQASAVEIIDLLLHGVQKRSTLALINMALLFVQILQEDRDWALADRMIELISVDDLDFSQALSWWYQLDEEGDSEGALVIQWLNRHKKLPQSLSIMQILRISSLKDNKQIPSWIFETA